MPMFLIHTVMICASVLVLACDMPAVPTWCCSLLLLLAVGESADAVACYIADPSAKAAWSSSMLLLLVLGVTAVMA